MNKSWLVMKHEYFRYVKRKRFILALLSLPLLVKLQMVAIGVLSATLSFDDKPVGYLDRSGVLSQPIQPDVEAPVPFRKPIKFIPFQEELQQANASLESNQIQAFYTIPWITWKLVRLKSFRKKRSIEVSIMRFGYS